jgi:hypothetical protein
MKAKISKLNNLLLERERGEFISQICFGGDNCGLRCPLFRIYNDPINGNPKSKRLHFCHEVTFRVDEIIYETEVKEGKG